LISESYVTGVSNFGITVKLVEMIVKGCVSGMAMIARNLRH
jgi:hypothetical protein